MKRHVVVCLAALAILCAARSASADDARVIPFEGIEDGAIRAEIVTAGGGAKALRVGGVVLHPKSQIYMDAPEDGYLTGSLSPDRSRILVALAHIEEKNLWVVNPGTSKLEFESHENAGRHMFPKWLGATRFEVTYGGMGYRVERRYELRGGAWTLTRDKTVTGE